MTRRSAKVREGSACADGLRVLADPARLGVLESLLARPRRVAELGRVLGVERSLLSHHLRDAGLLAATRGGNAVRYPLAAAGELDHAPRVSRLGCCDLSFEPRSRD
jgi:DNA-binding transcriptional ArsR family regulator